MMVANGNSNVLNNGNKYKISPIAILTVLLLLTVIGIYVPILLHLTNDGGNSDLSKTSSSSSSSSSNAYDTGLRRRGGLHLPATFQRGVKNDNGDNYAQHLEDRIRYLETKLDSYLAYNSDPFLRLKNPAPCKQRRMIQDIACTKEQQLNAATCAVDNQMICLDNFPGSATKVTSASSAKNNGDSSTTSSCVVYDFGIRESPEYGLAFVKAPFNCEVVGFDPSPISVKWWSENKSKLLKSKTTGGGGSYNFLPVGAGGTDGKLTLREYDWDQVSIIEFPQRVVNPDDCNSDGQCKFHFHNKQANHEITVSTLEAVMTKLGHDRITLLKLDVEGSEYLFVEKMIDDLSCRHVDQLTLEWHHYSYDTRYGVTSNPQINMLVALLDERCGLQQYWTHESTGWPSNQKVYAEMHMTLYYTLSSFIRTRWEFN